MEKKTLKETETTMEEILQDIKDKFDQAVQGKAGKESEVMTLASSKKAIEKAIQDMSKHILDSCKNIQKLCKNFNLVDELNITLRQLETEASLLTSTVARQQADDFIKSIKILIDNLSKQQALERKTAPSKKQGGAFTGGAEKTNKPIKLPSKRKEEEEALKKALEESEIEEAKRRSIEEAKKKAAPPITPRSKPENEKRGAMKVEDEEEESDDEEDNRKKKRKKGKKPKKEA